MLMELLPGTDNVIRFPVEMREKLYIRLLRQLQPDVRNLFMHAKGLGFALPPIDLCDHADQATAEHVAAHLDGDDHFVQTEPLERLYSHKVLAA